MASVADASLSTVATTFGAAVLSNDETAPLERLAAIHERS